MDWFLTPWADDSRSKPAGGVFSGSVATREVDLSTKVTHHTHLHVDPVINQFNRVIYAGKRVKLISENEVWCCLLATSDLCVNDSKVKFVRKVTYDDGCRLGWTPTKRLVKETK